MEIVSWSPMHGQSASTSNVLMLSLLCGMRYKKSCLLTQTHFNYNNLEAPLVESNTKSSSDYFMDVGIDALIRRFKAERLDKKLIENCCITLPGTNISLLPGTTKINKEAFDDEIGLIAPGLIREISSFYDIVFVDASPSVNDLSRQLMHDADMIVVNLSQNTGVIDMLFHSYQDINSSKIFFLFGAYDCNSIYNIHNIRRKYKEITINNSGVIPYNTAFRDAQIESKVVEFVRKNIDCGRYTDNYYFMTKSINATDKLLKRCRKLSDRAEVVHEL